MAVTYDASSATAKVYVDGVMKASCGGFDTNPSNIELTHLVIGGSIFDDLYWTGELGCFRLYDRALRYKALHVTLLQAKLQKTHWGAGC